MPLVKPLCIPNANFFLCFTLRTSSDPLSCACGQTGTGIVWRVRAAYGLLDWIPLV